MIQQAADKDFASAEFGLGSIDGNGRGVKQDLPKAVEWYSKAVDRGDAGAMNNLAWLFMNAQMPTSATRLRRWTCHSAPQARVRKRSLSILTPWPAPILMTAIGNRPLRRRRKLQHSGRKTKHTITRSSTTKRSPKQPRSFPHSTELENWYVPVPMVLLPNRCLHLIRRLRTQLGR